MLQELDVRLEQAILTDLVQVRATFRLHALRVQPFLLAVDTQHIRYP